MKILGFETNAYKRFIESFAKQKDTGAGGRLIQADKDIIAKIVNAFKDTSRKNIEKWRTAIQLTQLPEKPRFQMFQDLIDDLSTDGHLKAQIRLRTYSILNTEFSIIDKTNNKSNEEASEFFNQQWFYDFLSHAIDASFRGHTLIEFKAFWKDKIELALVPRRNVVPQDKLVIPDLGKQDTVDYTDPFFEDWLIEIGSADNLGILNDIVPNLIWKRNVAQSWAEFCEKFGMPMVTATTNTTDSKQLDKIEYMLQQIGEASTGVFPLGTTVDIKEASRTDAYQTYSNFIAFNREEISVAIVGGTMLTNDGASRSQSEVHERNLDDKIAIAEKRSLTFLVNDVLMPLLKNQGYTFIKDNDKFTFNKSHNLALDKFWKITQGVLKDYEIDDIEWLSSTFHIPIAGKKKVQTQPTNLTNVTALGVRIPNYPEALCCGNFTAVASSVRDKIKILQEQLARDIWENKNTIGSQAQIIADESLLYIKGFQNGWTGRAEAAWDAPDHLMLQTMELNIVEFAASKTEARLAAMTDLMINRDKNQIRSFNDFKNEVDKVTSNYNKTWLETEYNFTIATAQNSAAYIRQKSEADSVTPYVQYQTVGDDHVREEHQLLDGKVFNLNDPEAMRLYPPNGYNCRCEMIQYVGDKSKVVTGKAAMSLMGDSFKDSDFSFNRADAKQVFTKSQFYTDDGEILNKINDINYTSYSGLSSLKVLQKGLKKLKLDTTIIPGNKDELFRIDGKRGKQAFMGFSDHLQRKIILKNDVYKSHTSGKYLKIGEDRHQLFPHVKNALNNADEVWLNAVSDKKYQMRYLKFFANDVLVVETILGSTNNEITTWYKMKAKEEVIRKGLKIK